ncbi:LamG-like jellyroll fold domain-containing protein [Longispora albida]|uniref:LamG-like jellyroll fold domain-containing protein n=1 Tax=Longispora albida TaxID=203523 RepID=UPI0003A7867C|nr:LamG-like jellyroll fold domain-containing protein [Longispora albida]
MSSAVHAPRRGALLPRILAVALGVVSLPAMALPASAQDKPPCGDGVSTPAAAASLARACGGQVEVLDQRSETSQVFALPNGTFTASMHARPVRAKLPDGRWAAVDTKLQATGGRIAPAVSPAGVVFSAGGTGPAVVLTTQGKRVELTWPEALPVPSLSGDTATYPEVMPGVDLALRATLTGFSHVLVVKNVQAAASPKLAGLRFGLMGGPGVTIQQGSEGRLSATGADGKVLATSGTASMWDSAGEAEPGKRRPAAAAHAEPASAAAPGERSARSGVAMRMEQGQLVLAPDANWLKDGKRAFPIYLDPEWHSTGPSRWAYANHNNWDNSDGRAWVGRDYTHGNLLRSYFEFPIGAVAGSNILSATFNASLSHSASCTATPVSLWRARGITSTPRSNWGIPLDVFLQAKSGNANKDACPQPDMPMAFDVRGDMQAVANENWSSYTLALSAADASGANEWATDRWKKFHANPVLSVNFNRAPVAYEPSSVPETPCLTGSGRPMLGGSSSSPIPEVRLKARVRDNADNSSATFELYYTNGNLIQSVNDGRYLAAGSEHQWTIPSGVLQDGKTYSWRVQGHDGTTAGGYTQWCEFTVNTSAPKPPNVTSTELKLTTDIPMGTVTAKVGAPAAVHVAPNGDTDIAYYKYSVAAGAAPASADNRVTAAPDGRAVLPVVPVSADGGRFNYLRVETYDTAGNNSSAVYKFKANPGNGLTTRGDATGDGIADLTTIGDIGGGKSAIWQFSSTAGQTVASAVLENSTGASGGKLMARGDFDQDGKSDVAQLVTKGTGIALNLLRSTDTGTSEIEVWSKTDWTLPSVQLVAGNFDGDLTLRDDLAILLRKSAQDWEIHVLAADGALGSPHFAAPVLWGTSATLNFAGLQTGAGDVDGDRKADLIGLSDAGNCNSALHVWTSTGVAFQAPAISWHSGSIPAQARTWCWGNTKAAFGDFNADKKIDFAVAYNHPNCQTALRVSYAKVDGTGFASPVEPWKSAAQNWCGASTAQAGDFDGDGKADVGLLVDVSAVAGSATGYHHQLWVLGSTGSGFSAPAMKWDGALGNRSTPSLSFTDPAARYQLVAAHSGKCVGIGGGTTATATQFTQQSCSASIPEHTVQILPVGGGTYAIKPGHAVGTLCMDQEFGQMADSAKISQYPCGSQINVPQVFTFGYVAGFSQPQVEIKVMHSKKCISVSWAGQTDGTPLIQYTCAGQTDTRFDIRRIPAPVGGLAGSWQMNSAADSSGRAENLTLTDGTTLSNGTAVFDGSNDAAHAPGPVIDLNSSFTVGAWVKLTNKDWWRVAVSQDGSRRAGLNLQFDKDTGKWVFSRSAADNDSAAMTTVYSAEPAQLNTWTHLAGVYDAPAGKIKLYVNGVFQNEIPFAGTWTPRGSLVIGRGRWTGVASAYWAGSIDGVEAYNRVLTGDELQAWGAPFDTALPQQLVAQHSELCVTTPPGPIGPQVQQQACGTALQNGQYKLVRIGATEFSISGVHAAGCLDLQNWGTADGTIFGHWHCSGSTATMFTIVRVPDPGTEPVYEIRPLTTGKCMAVAGGSPDSGAGVSQWPCSGKKETQFLLRTVYPAGSDAVATWQMNDEGGEALFDTTGGANAKITGSVTTAGGTATFTGASGAATTTGPVVNATKSFTVSAWAYLNHTSYSAVVAGQEGSRLMGFNLSYCKGCNAWQFERAGSDADSPASWHSVTGTAPQLNTWTHLVGTYDAATGTQKLYINGVLAGSNTFTAPWPVQGPIVIGKGKWQGSPTAGFTGQIDDVRIYHAALDATAVLNLRNTGRE